MSHLPTLKMSLDVLRYVIIISYICRYNLTAFSEDSNGTVIGIIKAVDPDSADTGMVSNHGN